MAESSETGIRALGMLQALARNFAQGDQVPVGPERGIVSKQVALDAVMHVFAATDDALQSDVIEQGRGLYVMEMLMLLREYIEPLPDPPGDEALLREDLNYLSDAVTEARRQEFG